MKRIRLNEDDINLSIIKPKVLIILIFLILFLTSATYTAEAQTNWQFKTLNGTFTPLSNPTQVSSIQDDDAVSDVIDIGFTFSFNRVDYTQIVASSNGFLSFNTDASSAYNNDLTNSSNRPLIAPLWDDLNGEECTAGYKLEGTAPDRVFTFEWLNWKWNYSASEAVISFQVKLYETSNRIEFIYQQEAAEPNSPSASIGLAFQDTGSDNFLSLSDASDSPEFSTTTEFYEIDTKPVTGQIYQFEFIIKPEPSEHATDYTGLFSNYSIALSWTDATGSQLPDGYVIYASDENDFTDPVDGVDITTDSDLSDGEGCVSVTQGIENYYSFMNFLPTTTYYFRIYTYTNTGDLIDFKTDGTIPETQLTTPAIIYPFSEQSDISLTGVYNGKSTWGDYDNNGYLDILLTGYTGSSYISKIYQNDKSGNFTELIGLPLTGVGTGFVTWGDYDNDNDLDILLAGYTGTANISKIYQNNSGSFVDINATLIIGSGTEGAWSDYDNDGDLDLLITANTGTRAEVSAVYRNDNGVFTNINAGLKGVGGGSVDWGDLDNDGDLDILLSGTYLGTYSYIQISKAYRNDNGTFNEITIDFPPGCSGNLSWCDYDSDGDLDIIFGCEKGYGPVLKILRNDNGTFNDAYAFTTEMYTNSSSFGDFDNDGDIDILLSGKDEESQPVTKLFSNNSGVYSEINSNLPGVSNSSVSFGDYDNDGDLDILLTGNTVSGYISKVFRNETVNINTRPSAPENPEVTVNNELVNFNWSKSTDNETVQDGLNYNLYVFESGLETFIRSPHAFKQTHELNGKRLIAKIGNIQWSENGYTLKTLTADKTYSWSVQAIDAGLTGGEFTSEESFYLPYYKPSVPASNISFSSNEAFSKIDISWTNGNGENRTVFIKESSTGTADPVDNTSYSVDSYTPGGWKCIYNGTGNSIELTDLIPGVDYSLHVCEYNGTPGYEKYYTETTTRNPIIVNPVFTEINSEFSVAAYPEIIKWGDYDNDGDLDILFIGSTTGSYSSAVTKIYRNDSGTFTDISATLTGVYRSSAAWGDYDNDGDLDLLISGTKVGGQSSTIYRNDEGAFTNIGAVLTGTYRCSVAWGDYDNDGDLDALISGFGIAPKIYRNDSGSFYAINNGLPTVTVADSYVVWGDYDNDGDLDILLKGNTFSEYISEIYRNDAGTFTSINSNLATLAYGGAAWGDYDNDGDLDIVSIGKNSSGNLFSKIYRNDAGEFYDINADLAILSNASAIWGDYDNDGDLDILLTGPNTTKIYKNNAGIFNAINSDINIMQNSTVIWGDYDNDGDLDILQTGNPGTGGIIKLYQNNLTNHNQNPSIPGNIQASFNNESVIFQWDKSVDNETDRDGLTYNLYVYETGQTTFQRSPHAFVQTDVLNGQSLVVKMGDIQWSENGFPLNYLPVEKEFYWSVQAVDAGLSGGEFATEQSFVMPAYKPRFQAKNIVIGTILLNQVSISWTAGSGSNRVVFVKEQTNETPDLEDNTTYNIDDITTGGWRCVYNGSGTTTDIFGLAPGTVYSIIVCEYNGSPGSEKYLTISAENNPGLINPIFSTNIATLDGVDRSSFAWGDYDNDGDLDVVLAGNNGSTGISKLYNNDAGIFSDAGAGLAGVSFSSVAWGDYDNDQDIDLLLTGYTGSQRITKLYNNDEGIFSEVSTDITGVSHSSVAWGDYDNDGDLDVLLTGLSESGYISKIYNNDSGIFKDSNAGLTGAYYGSVEWGDYDNDGDLDVLLTGYVSSSENISKIYRNDLGTFTDINAGLTGIWYGSAKWGDYDNDGDLDILLSGAKTDDTYDPVSKIYRNDGNDTFSDQTDIILTAVSYSSLDWGDFENDGDLDIIISGMTNDYKRISKIYQNNDGIFTDYYEGLYFTGLHQGSAKFGDYDMDGNLDIFMSGYTDTGIRLSVIYKNYSLIHNTLPEAPENLHAEVGNNNITLLEWDKSTDPETDQNSLTYNIYIGNTPSNGNIISPMSQIPGGSRSIVRSGDLQNNSIEIKCLPADTYYWSVQSIDAVYSGSPFADENSFTIEFSNIISPKDNQTIEPGQDGTMLTVSESNTPESRQWKYSMAIDSPFIDIPEETDITYTPNFSSPGIHYVICESVYNSTKYQSNMVKVTLPYFSDEGSISPGVRFGSAAWGDYDGDNDLDVIISGNTGSENISKIYQNNNSVFNDIDAGLAGFSSSTVVWGDYDNDGDLDILISGYSSEKSIKVYNNDNEIFTEIFSALSEEYKNEIVWSDYDSDGDLDILCSTGEVYQNDSGVFTEEDIGIIENGENIACGDYDNDGDIDLLFSSGNLYRNDEGTFTCITSALESIYNGSIKWGDYDSDGDLDVLITGGFISKVYQNNEGSFVDINAGLTGVSYGYADWGDYDNDGDLDIILTGNKINYSGRITKLYNNNGNGSFTENKDLSFIDIDVGNVAWGDYDNDNNLDILLLGESSSGYISKLYSNNCTTVNDPPDQIQNLDYDILFKDVILKWNTGTDDKTLSKSLSYNLRIGTSSLSDDYVPSHSLNTGYRKIVQIGNTMLDTVHILKNVRWNTYFASIQAIDNSYMGGPFSDEIQFEFYPVQPSGLTGTNISNSSLMLKWIRGNGDYCIVFAKEGETGNAVPVDNFTYYYNPAFGEGSPIDDSGWYCIYKGVGDSVLLSGLSPDKNYIVHAIEFQGKNGSEKYAAIVSNENIGIFSTSLFIEQTGISLPGVENSAIGWADYDNDGDMDLLLTGDIYTDYISKIYQNNSDNTFTEAFSLPGVYNGSVAWCDYDNNGYQDVLLSGQPYSDESFSVILRNGDFTDIEAGLDGVAYGSSDWGDYDNDGDLDILLTGDVSYPIYSEISKVFRNDDGLFHQSVVLPGLSVSSCKWGDYDNDGDLDILLAGDSGSEIIAKIYQNNDGVFSDIDAGLTGIVYGSLAWFDYDNDADLDIIICGEDQDNKASTKIYRNNEDNSFTEQTQISIKDLYNSSVDIGDYDNDGYPDILINGSDDFNEKYTKIYHNDKNGTFSELTVAGLTNVEEGAVSWIDYDNDGDLDILITGNDENGDMIAKMYRNNLIMKAGNYKPNKKPSAPTNLLTSISPRKVNLSWSPADDDETPSSTLSYNIRFRLEGEDNWKNAPHAGDNGLRRLPEMGNLQMNNFHVLKNLPSGKYYWQVQTVDQGYLGSTWSVIDSFEVKNTQAFFTFDTVCLGFANTFTDQSVSTDGIASWYWDFHDGETSTEQNPVHTFASSGTYNVKLLITDNLGLRDSLVQDIIVKSIPLTGFYAPIVCQGSSTPITNNTDNNGLTVTSWFWDFGDGQTSLLEQPAPHGYLGAADYIVTLKALADNGCRDSVLKTVTVASYPAVAVTADAPLTFCEGDSVTLSVSYNNNNFYNWMVGGANLTGGDSSKYVAKSSGSYTVEVINSIGNCRDTSFAVIITAQDAPAAPFISAEGSLEFCQGDSVILSVTNTPGYSYQWKLNGGAVGADSSRYSAKASGTYSITVSNSTGCSVDATNNVDVIVNPIPTIPTVSISGPTTFCEGDNVELSVTNNPDYTYQWENNSAAITGATTNSYIAQNSGVYTLKITNSSGCFIKTEDVTVNVLDAPSAPLISTDGDLEFCQGDSVVLSVTPTAGYTYQWKLNGGAVGTDSSQYCAKSSGTYSLTVSNSTGCSVDATNTVSVTVNPVPTLPTVNISGPTTFCEGDTVGLSVTDNPAYTYQWENNGSLITGDTSNSYKALTTGTYKLNISNSYGCVTITSPVTVTVKPMPYVPVITSDNYNPGECMGETPIRLYVDQEVPGYSYQWYRNGIPVAGETLSYIEDFLTEGDYSLEADLDGCTAESDIMNVYYEDAPDKPFIHAQGPTVWYLVCSDTTGSNYRWYCNGNLIERANKYYYIAGRKMGDYQVSISNSLGCFTRSEIVTIPTGDTGMDDVDPFEGLKIYPNPTNGLFVAEIENGIMGNLFIKIISQDGKELFNFMFEKTSVHFSTKLNISRQTKGYYLIIFDLNKQVAVRRIIID